MLENYRYTITKPNSLTAMDRATDRNSEKRAVRLRTE